MSTWTFAGTVSASGSSRRWTLDADPRYAVEDCGPDGYLMSVDGYEVDRAETPESALAQLEARYEYAAHASDLATARLRVRQIRERLVNRFPTAARDAQLASVLEGLDDALGAGPEAEADREAASSLPAKNSFGRLLTPDLAIAVDGSQCIVLLVTEPYGKLLRVVPVTDVEAFKTALDDAHTVQQAVLSAADTARYRGPDEKRRAEGRLDKRAAVEWLMEKLPCSRNRAVHIAFELRDGAAGGPFTEGMTYDGTYWVVPAEQG